MTIHNKKIINIKKEHAKAIKKLNDKIEEQNNTIEKLRGEHDRYNVMIEANEEVIETLKKDKSRLQKLYNDCIANHVKSDNIKWELDKVLTQKCEKNKENNNASIEYKRLGKQIKKIMLDTSYIVNIVKKLSSNTQKEIINTLDQDNKFYKMIIYSINEKI